MGSRRIRCTPVLRNTLLSVCLCTLIACGPSTPEERMSAAREAIESGDPRAAEIHLKNLLRENPDNGDARHLLGELLLAAGDPAGGEQSLLRAIELGTPIAIEKGLRFAIREGGRTVGAGTVTEILE